MDFRRAKVYKHMQSLACTGSDASILALPDRAARLCGDMNPGLVGLFH